MRKQRGLLLVLLVSASGVALAEGSSEPRPAHAGRPAAAAVHNSGLGDNPIGGKTDNRAGLPPRAEDLSGPPSAAVASPMRYYAVTKLDPLTGSTMDSVGSQETPSMAGSTGAWTRPAAGSPQEEWKPRGTGHQVEGVDNHP
jgi:hypothetical protein